MNRFSLLLLGLLSALICGCTKEENEHAVLLFGAQSFPDFEEIAVGAEVIAEEQQLSVAGDGDFGQNEWGILNCRYTSGETHTFTSGGVVAWAPPGEGFEEISGEAKVELFAYLLTATADDNLKPSTMVVRRKWRIPEGSFNLKIKKDNKSEMATPRKPSD